MAAKEVICNFLREGGILKMLTSLRKGGSE